ncbi:MAG: 5-formyltetrahydrofolate cyclo-ligase [Verrucomicrobiales bacterium]|nr:5-formyltetrahydrofolate cyclo-ligase [Verrucomicrobiales bacterium]
MRRSCFAALKAMTGSEKNAGSMEICRQLENLDAFQKADTVFGYLPLPSEPDLSPLFSEKRVWGFAKVLEDDSMEFRRMESLDHAVAGDFKILEPDPRFCPVLSPDHVDIVIIPGVGFCPRTGNRLGRGKGHYDRYLRKLRERKTPPLLVGVCFAAQLCEVESEPHDISMDLVISA